MDSRRQKFRALLAKREDDQKKRYRELCVVWRRQATGEILLKVGGVWDSQERRYVSEAADGRIIDLEESQVEAAQLAAWWIQQRLANEPRDFCALFLIGNRGSGKTTFSEILVGTFVVAFPTFDNSPSITWQVSSSHAERDELDRELQQHLPGAWYHYTEFPKHVYKWAHGPTTTNVSADDPDALKRGRVDLAFFNEAQKISKRAIAYGIARLKDKGGLTVFAGNWPNTLKGKWILDLHKKAEEKREAGEPFPIAFVEMKAAANRHQDNAVADQLTEIITILDPRIAAADIDGRLLRVDQPAYWEYSKQKHVRELPQLGDITREFTRRRTGREYDCIAAVDFQATPHMAASLWKIFGTVKEPLLWAFDELVVEQASEEDLISELADNEYAPENTLVIGDASGQWQDGKHNHERDSFQVFRAHRYHIIAPTKPKSKTRRSANPPVEQRIKLHNQVLQVQQMLFSPSCTKLQEAHAECPLREGRYGKVYPYGFYAHLTDTAGYLAWWAFPKPQLARDGGALAQSIDPFSVATRERP